jgi:hypothetical protein
MPPAQFTSPFPKLELTHEQREQLQTMAYSLVDEALAQYEQFINEDRGTLDGSKWVLQRTKEDVRVYHDRRSAADTGNKDMQMLLTYGTVLGDLNDAMYGVISHTTDAMRIKTEYVDDATMDSAVLETVLDPTADEPFQSMTVRWYVKSVPMRVRAVSKHRDSVYLEATGFRRLSNGEHVGYHLMHSIAFPKTPALPTYDRANMSICSLWRQQTPQRVEVYQTAFYELKDSMLLPLMIKSTADTLISLAKIIECAQMKKLAHLVACKSTFTAPPDADGAAGDGCAVCGGNARSARRGAKSACVICPKAICKQCVIKRELILCAPGGNLLKQELRFCLHCLTTAHQLNAAEIARAEVPKHRARASSLHRRTPHERSAGGYTSSTSSGVSSDDRLYQKL